MLGTEPEITRDYVLDGQVKLIFWPVLNHGNPSVYATITAECVGRQNPAAFWGVHKLLFENQSELWRADRDYFVQTAVSVGADEATFAACYDDPETLRHVQQMDEIRRQWGIYIQPTFDINGNLLVGAQSYDTFAEAIEQALGN